ncbi:NAD(P)H-dependent oxidoreductase subunit E [Spirochaetota bacterium]
MVFIPIIIMNSILLVITILLAIADKLLVSYGECKVTLKKEDDEQVFTVDGGGTLLSALIANNIEISAPCGGRGSCGYCKVQVSSGGGPLLPTEEIFVSKEEEKDGTRLACQVKVKEDLQIFIPDLLTSVKHMVKSGSFDTKLKWRFIRADRLSDTPVERKIKRLDRRDRMTVEEIVEKYKDTDGAIMPVLQEVNVKYKYLPEPVLRSVSRDMDMPVSTVFRIATFYNTFSLKPRGKYIISICTGTACHVKGAADILTRFEDALKIKAGETTEDMTFTLDAVRCIGCCGLAPVITINEEVHGLMTKKKVPELIEMYTGM